MFKKCDFLQMCGDCTQQNEKKNILLQTKIINIVKCFIFLKIDFENA